MSGDPTCLQQVGTYYTHSLSLSLERERRTRSQSPVRSPAPYTYTPENGAAKIVVRQHDDDVHEHPQASICMA